MPRQPSKTAAHAAAQRCDESPSPNFADRREAVRRGQVRPRRAAPEFAIRHRSLRAPSVRLGSDRFGGARTPKFLSGVETRNRHRADGGLCLAGISGPPTRRPREIHPASTVHLRWSTAADRFATPICSPMRAPRLRRPRRNPPPQVGVDSQSNHPDWQRAIHRDAQRCVRRVPTNRAMSHSRRATRHGAIAIGSWPHRRASLRWQAKSAGARSCQESKVPSLLPCLVK